jgi:hypothetical protein
MFANLQYKGETIVLTCSKQRVFPVDYQVTVERRRALGHREIRLDEEQGKRNSHL